VFRAGKRSDPGHRGRAPRDRCSANGSGPARAGARTGWSWWRWTCPLSSAVPSARLYRRPQSRWIIGMWWRGRTRWSPRSAGAVRVTCTAGGAGPLLKTDHIDAFHRSWAELEHAVKATGMRETKSLFLTLKIWLREELTFCRTRVTNARSKPPTSTRRTSNEPARIPESWPLQAPASVVHASPTSMLNTCRHAKSGSHYSVSWL
jgi:hypothetical protein